MSDVEFRKRYKILSFFQCLAEYEKYVPIALDVDYAMRSMCVLVYSGLNLRLTKIIQLNIPGSRLLDCKKIALEVEYDKMEQIEFEGEEAQAYRLVFRKCRILG